MIVWTFFGIWNFFEIWMKTDLFQSCDHCWAFQICWHIECIHVVSRIKQLFYFYCWNIPLFRYVQFVHLYVDGHVGFSLAFGYYENTAKNNYALSFVWTYVFISLGFIPTNRISGSFTDSSAGKEFNCNVGDSSSIPGWEDPLEKGIATPSSILAWRIPWTV